MAGEIFISYRRDDAAASAGRLADNLKPSFSADAIFMDVDGIKPGIDFVDLLTARLAECRVMLVVVGRQWLSIGDQRGRRRLDDANDYVRHEVSSAIRRGIPAIPVLVEGAEMPHEAELPDNLKPFARRNAVRLTHERFGQDVAHLVEHLEYDILPPTWRLVARDALRGVADMANSAAEKISTDAFMAALKETRTAQWLQEKTSPPRVVRRGDDKSDKSKG